MICEIPEPVFASPYDIGIKECRPYPDGYTIYAKWAQALPSTYSYEIGYNLYFSSDKNTVLTEGPKYFTRYSELTVRRFNPGETYYFLVRATQYLPIEMNPLNFPASPQATNGFSYPETALASNINESALIIPLIDIAEFPAYGILKIGYELIKYINVDYSLNIIYASTDGRGYYNTLAREHTIDGYDGYDYLDPVVRYYEGFEDLNVIYSQAQARFEQTEFPFTDSDGYRNKSKDLLNTDLTSSDEAMEDFPKYDNSGYHRTSIVDYFSGICLGSYHGGEYGCAGADGSGRIRSGINIQDQSAQRLEELLQVTGESIVLLRRKWTGITCNCFRLNQENPDGRCPVCLATSFVGGYDQFFNPRRSDGRLLMRFPPTVDDLAAKPHGLQQNFAPSGAWTLVTPILHDRDVIIRFNLDGTEEYRYEIVNVNRNKLMFSYSGVQTMNLYRLDKTDIIYQWRAIRSTALIPGNLNTTMSVLRGHGPHFHVVTINESITTLPQINSTTSTTMGHNHPIIDGVVQDVLGHTHTIIL